MKIERDINGMPQKTVFCVLDRYYLTRQEAQVAVDAICDAGYGIEVIEEIKIDAPELDRPRQDF